MTDLNETTDRDRIEKFADWLMKHRLRWIFAFAIAATLLMIGIAIGIAFAGYAVFGVSSDASPDQVTYITEMMSDRGAAPIDSSSPN